MVPLYTSLFKCISGRYKMDLNNIIMLMYRVKMALYVRTLHGKVYLLNTW